MSNLDPVFGAESAGYRGAAMMDAVGAGVSHDGRARWARPLLIALTAICAVVLLCRFAGEPLTRIHHVTVHSDVPLSDDQMLALSGIPAGAHWYSVSAQDIEQRLEASPLVYRARVERVFPDTVRMTVWARQPAALVLASVDGRSLPVLVDGEGVVYKVGTTGPDLDLPVVSGLTAGDMSLGARLPRHYGALFSDLRALREKAPALYAALSEVRVTAPSARAGAAAPAAAAGPYPDASPQELEMLVYLTSTRVPIRTRGAIDEGFVKYALMVVDLLSRQGVLQNIQELDFRNGDAVYRTRGSGAPAGSAEGGMSR